MAAQAKVLTGFRSALLKACERRYELATKLAEEAAALGLRPLKEVVRNKAGARVAKNEAFAIDPSLTLVLGSVTQNEPGWILPLDVEAGHTMTFNEEEIANLAAAGLALLQGAEVGWNDILNAAIPVTPKMAEALAKLREDYAPERLDAEIDALIVKLDDVVGPALGLTAADIEEIRRDMDDDPFLSRVRPRYPFFRPRQYGRRKNLERRNRYALTQSGTAEDNGYAHNTRHSWCW